MAQPNDPLQFLEMPANNPSPSSYFQQRKKFQKPNQIPGGSSAAATFSLVLHKVQDNYKSYVNASIKGLTRANWERAHHSAVRICNTCLENERLGGGNIPLVNATFVGLTSELESPYVQAPEIPFHYRCRKGLPERDESSFEEIAFRIFEVMHLISSFRRERVPDTMAIIVSSRVRFLIDINLLAKNSEYFSTMFASSNAWTETQTGILRIPEANGEALGIYSLWVSTGEIQIDRHVGWSSFAWTSLYVGNTKNITKTWIRMAKLNLLLECCILGDYLQAPLEFQDSLMSDIIGTLGEIHKSSTGSVPLGIIRSLWDRTVLGSPVRNVIVDMMSSCLSDGTKREALKLGILSIDIVNEVISIGTASTASEFELSPPWCTYRPRYFFYARSTPLSQKKGLLLAARPFWDAVGTELLLPDEEF